MSGIQANTLVDFSVFSIYDPNDAAKKDSCNAFVLQKS